MKLENKGFTLVELLVVISMISLLSTIVLASLSSTREKARITKLLVFSSSIASTNYPDVVGDWTFNDSSNLGRDLSGNGKNGSNEGGVWNANGVEGGAFDAGDQEGYIEITDTTPSSLGTGKKAITIDIFIKPTTDSVSFGIVGKNAYNLYYYPVRGTCLKCLSFRINGESIYTAQFAQSVEMTPNRWHHIAATYDSEKRFIKVFFDAKELTAPQIYTMPASPYPIQEESDDLQLGYSAYYTGNIVPGLIDRVRIYSSALGF